MSELDDTIKHLDRALELTKEIDELNDRCIKQARLRGLVLGFGTGFVLGPIYFWYVYPFLYHIPTWLAGGR